MLVLNKNNQLKIAARNYRNAHAALVSAEAGLLEHAIEALGEAIAESGQDVLSFAYMAKGTVFHIRDGREIQKICYRSMYLSGGKVVQVLGNRYSPKGVMYKKTSYWSLSYIIQHLATQNEIKACK